MNEILLASIKRSSWDGDSGPGPKDLIYDDGDSGFFGELRPDDFIKGSDMASSLNLTYGIVYNDTANWLKFYCDEKVIFTPSIPLRHSLSWNNLKDSSLLYGDRTIVIQNKVFKVRTFNGTIDGDPTNMPNMYNTVNWGDDTSEWGRTFLKLGSGHWESRVAGDLGVHSSIGGCWCQEQSAASSTNAALRGGGAVGVWFFGLRGKTEAVSSRNWRPVLELQV